MNILHIDLNDDNFIKKVCKSAYPAYNGRKFKVIFDTQKMNCRSYWDEGSRTLYAMVRLSDMEVAHAPSNAHPFFTTVQGVDSVTIPEGFVIVAHSISRGKDMGLTIYSPDVPKLLAHGEELSTEETNVLYATRVYKSSYAGVSDYRAQELRHAVGMSQAKVNEIRNTLIERGYMSKNKALTTKGKNAVANMWNFIK